MAAPRYPLLYQVNTRVWLTELSRALGRRATFDDIPDSEVDRLAEMGFDWVWMLSVWQTGAVAQQVSRNNAQWRSEFEETLPDLREEDIAGSGFAITGYTAHTDLGGDAALARLRERLGKRGLKLMLDFVPNHVGLGHPWVEDHPDYFIQGSELDWARAPHNYTWVKGNDGDVLLAHGRDPYFPGWPDTLQLNYANPVVQATMAAELARIAGQCDGVRCDMAMLVLPEIFERTWGQCTSPFWPKTIGSVREQFPDFLFMAEVYWDLEWTLQQQGFDYAYDKRLYDHLRAGMPRPVREHFLAGPEYQSKLTRFLENHDEARAAATFRPGVHEAAAAVTFLSPGPRFFHQGQFEGRLKRISPHLSRGPDEPVNETSKAFYERLLDVLRRPALRDGQWQMLDCAPAWDGNWTSDCFLAFLWQGSEGEKLLVVVNFSDHQSQCYVQLPFADLSNQSWQLQDHFSAKCFDREGADLQTRGLFLDETPWAASAYSISKRSCGAPLRPIDDH